MNDDIEWTIRDIVANIHHTMSKEEALLELIRVCNEAYEKGYIAGYVDSACINNNQYDE